MKQTAAEISTFIADYTLIEKENFGGKQLTRIEKFKVDSYTIPRFINEFWTPRQRQNNPIHEISYRACFKAELPRFFISLLTEEEDVVYDPFSGRGTTIIEAALLGRKVISNDINPLSKILCYPRLFIPPRQEVEYRLKEISLMENLKADIDLSMFYHYKTEAEIVSLRNYLINKNRTGREDYVDRWIRMVATNRLTGHSKNFFSVYTLPPNQAVSRDRQRKINKERQQIPLYKNTRGIILKKTNDLIKKLTEGQIKQLRQIGEKALFFTEDAGSTKKINSNSVSLTVTSPPFLDVVNYKEDNWLRCWFNNLNIDEFSRGITVSRKLDEWKDTMSKIFDELYRITRKGGWIAFEVGEIRKGKIKLDEHIVPLGVNAGFRCEGIIVNLQKFTKTANIWGISNNNAGTNTNRIVIFRK